MALPIPLNGFVMQLRPSELESVAAGLGAHGLVSVLGEALHRLPTNDRAPLWELCVRHYGRRKPLEHAAGEIGMDVIHARKLLEAFSHARAEAEAHE